MPQTKYHHFDFFEAKSENPKESGNPILIERIHTFGPHPSGNDI